MLRCKKHWTFYQQKKEVERKVAAKSWKKMYRLRSVCLCWCCCLVWWAKMEYGAKDESKINDFFVSGIKKKKKKRCFLTILFVFFNVYLSHLFLLCASVNAKKYIYTFFLLIWPLVMGSFGNSSFFSFAKYSIIKKYAFCRIKSGDKSDRKNNERRNLCH